MDRDHTRRRFIETGLKGSLVALGSEALGSARAAWAAGKRRRARPSRPLSTARMGDDPKRLALRAADGIWAQRGEWT